MFDTRKLAAINAAIDLGYQVEEYYKFISRLGTTRLSKRNHRLANEDAYGSVFVVFVGAWNESIALLDLLTDIYSHVTQGCEREGNGEVISYTLVIE